MNTLDKIKQWFIDHDLENGRVVGLMVLSSKRRIWHDTEI